MAKQCEKVQHIGSKKNIRSKIKVKNKMQETGNENATRIRRISVQLKPIKLILGEL